MGTATRVATNAKATRQSQKLNGIEVFNADALTLYSDWAPPMVIISDGPYGLNSYPGDLKTPEELPAWYEPHVKAWSERCTPQTTLWFWGSEVGWATLHPLLVKYDWKYVTCHVWNKGIGHIAGNANTRTLRKFPVVTEVCVQYARNTRIDGLTLKDWVRREWDRSGLPLYKANEACGVDNAATRKYLTKDWLWYFPPPEAFGKLVDYVNKHGDPSGRPYFSADGKRPVTAQEWSRMRAKFHCPIGVTNVWSEPPVNGKERLKTGSKSLHMNQKPLKLMELIIEVSSDRGDLVWDPFGGLFTGALAALRLKRRCLSAEISKRYYKLGVERLRDVHSQKTLLTIGG